MNEVDEVIKRLEVSISNVTEEEYPDEYVQELIADAGQAVGMLKSIKGFNIRQIMYDMTRLAAAAGYVPDDFDTKATS